MSPLGNANQGPAPLLSQFHGSSSNVPSNAAFFSPGSPIPANSASAVNSNSASAALSLLGPALPQSIPASSDSVLPFPLNGNASGGNSSGGSVINNEARISLPSSTAPTLPTYSGILGGTGGNTASSVSSNSSPPNLTSGSQHNTGGHQNHGPVSHQQQHHPNSHGHGPTTHQANQHHNHGGNFHHNAVQHSNVNINNQQGSHSNLGQNSSNSSVGMIPALSLHQQHNNLSSAQAQNLQQQHHAAAAAAQFYAAQPQIFVNASGQAMYYRPGKI
jgi:hypothetical protein